MSRRRKNSHNKHYSHSRYARDVSKKNKKITKEDNKDLIEEVKSEKEETKLDISDITSQKKKISIFSQSLIVISILVLTIAIMLALAARWVFKTWAHLTMSQLVYQLKTSAEGTDQGIINSGILNIAVPAIFVLIALFICVHFLKKKMKPIFIVILNIALAIGVIIPTKTIVWNTLEIDDYLNSSSSEGEFIENNFVDAASVNMNFPETKRNLIYIYLESMEMTYSDKENGGAYDTNYIPELTTLAEENEDFSGEETTLNGGYSLYGSTWTIAGLFGQSSGMPLKINIDGNNMDTMDSFFPGLTTLGDILNQNGYKNVLMIGSDGAFGGRKLYFQSHGDYQIEDYYAAIEEGEIEEGYRVWWGYEDQKLLEFSKEKLTALAQEEQPFNFSLLTVDTHFEDGYVCGICGNEYDDQYANVIACSSRQIGEFVSWIQQQDWYENTTIVINGDHPTMDSNFCDGIDENYQRRTYTCIINSATSTESDAKKRIFSTLDNFPTTLAALGVEMDSDRLGLGTNLYSSTPTLIEEYGIDYLNGELAKKSTFMEELADLNFESEALLEREGYPSATITDLSFDANNQLISIRVDNYDNIGNGFDETYVEVTSSDGKKKITKELTNPNGQNSYYQAKFDVSSFVNDGTLNCNFAVYIRKNSGLEYKVAETNSVSGVKSYSNLGDFLSWISSNENYITFCAVRGDASFETNYRTNYFLNKMGMEKLDGQAGESYVALLRNGTVVEQWAIYDYLWMGDYLEDANIRYSLISAGDQFGDFASIIIDDEEYAKNERGYNFVVYDISLGQVIDSCVFNGNDYIIEQS